VWAQVDGKKLLCKVCSIPVSFPISFPINWKFIMKAHAKCDPHRRQVQLLKESTDGDHAKTQTYA